MPHHVAQVYDKSQYINFKKLKSGCEAAYRSGIMGASNPSNALSRIVDAIAPQLRGIQIASIERQP